MQSMDDTPEPIERITPVEAAVLRGKYKLFFAVFILSTAVVFLLLDRYAPNRPTKYDDLVEQFKYGSIGSDYEKGIPIEVLRVLPKVFPEYLPKGSSKDYTAFGFIQEPNHFLPIGFSKRRRTVDLTGLNCAACHTGVIRRTQNDHPMIVFGMPSNSIDLQSFFEFLFACSQDERFTPENLIPEIKKNTAFLPVLDEFIYRQAIAEMKAGLLLKKIQLDHILGSGHPRFGPGRVDTFNPYKVDQFWRAYKGKIPVEEIYGTADFPSIWNQAKREHLSLHWDGNNSSVKERNISAALGAGATPEHVDLQSLNRIADWIAHLPNPHVPDWMRVDQERAKKGKVLYEQNCSNCHSFSGAQVGRVDPIESIATDPGRLNSYTEKVRELQTGYTKQYPWAFKHFVKTNGYANQPLDGIWARAPYLHNGSVPTIYDLLLTQDKRPKKFFIGHGVVDEEKLGIRTDVDLVEGRNSFEFDTSLPGNSNSGHVGKAYGTELSDEEKKDIVEYMKTL